jgi:Mn2+/Fe2+ NRAMP family transporter
VVGLLLEGTKLDADPLLISYDSSSISTNSILAQSYITLQLCTLFASSMMLCVVQRHSWRTQRVGEPNRGSG